MLILNLFLLAAFTIGATIFYYEWRMEKSWSLLFLAISLAYFGGHTLAQIVITIHDKLA